MTEIIIVRPKKSHNLCNYNLFYDSNAATIAINNNLDFKEQYTYKYMRLLLVRLKSCF